MNKWINYPIMTALAGALWIIPTEYPEPAGIVLFTAALTTLFTLAVVTVADYYR